jgi:small subunit ribosomal protein S1
MNSATSRVLKVGDEVEVMVVEKEDREGNLNLSRKQARITRAWETNC